MFNNRKTLMIIVIAVSMVLVAVLSSFVSVKLYDYKLAKGGDYVVITSAQYTLWQKASRLNDIAAIINDEYIEKTDTDMLFEGAAKGMVSALGDQYAQYYTADEYKAFQEKKSGVYAGIGVAVIQDSEDSLVTVTTVYSGSPAEAAGILPGDKIVGVDGVNVRGMVTEDVVNLIKGEEGKQVVLSVQRDGVTSDYTMTLADVSIDRVFCNMLTDDIGYIRITEFNGDVVKQFKNALNELEGDGMTSLVLDLRDNPGGGLNNAVDIADMLVPKGLVVYTETRSGTRTEYESDDKCLDIPLIILVNEGSASASEVVTGCVQDYEMGTVLGTQTYGKGVVQTFHFFKEDGSALKLTTQYYYTPYGRCIDGVGLEPDVVVEQTYTEDGTDVQLQKAVELLSGSN